MTNILFFILGSFTTYFGLIFLKRKKNSLKRRGILERRYTIEINKALNATIEVEEIESTKDKSKIRVVELVADRSEYNNWLGKRKICSMINNSWVDKSDIEWIVDEQDIRKKEREIKLNNILN